MNPLKMLFRAILGGIIGAMLSATIWGAITYFSGYKIGYIAILVGLIVGFLVNAFGMAQGAINGIIAAIFALLACYLGNMGYVVFEVAKEVGISASDVITLVIIPNLAEISKEVVEPSDFLFWGIAVYEAYKIAKGGIHNARASRA